MAEGSRRLFEVDGVPFGITICHEGWRYPESVRWPAARGAKVVFHPQLTGSDLTGPTLTRWGDPDAPYYEKAMLMRSIENTVYFASVNYAFRYQESATSVIGPEGDLLAHVPYGDEQLLVYDLDLDQGDRLPRQAVQPGVVPAGLVWCRTISDQSYPVRTLAAAPASLGEAADVEPANLRLSRAAGDTHCVRSPSALTWLSVGSRLRRVMYRSRPRQGSSRGYAGE